MRAAYELSVQRARARFCSCASLSFCRICFWTTGMKVPMVICPLPRFAMRASWALRRVARLLRRGQCLGVWPLHLQ